ncbi:flagellar hook protein FlgE [Bosea sp. 2KB_26]|uniref:flagellar hook protein FlgE n=1 Tax=Bosea sp. 2KB_26 TaxID=3237475 RepID=UPI003F90E7F0
MSLFSVLRTGVSGMNAQSTKLGTVAENIANSNTTGFKRSGIEFSSLILSQDDSSYTSGSVETRVRRAISDPGSIAYTTSGSDLAVSGNGFFVVSDAKGTPLLTRAGNFVVDGPSGNLVNAAGFKLMGYSLENGAADILLNSSSNLVPVSIKSLSMKATPSTEGTFKGNLPVDAPVIAAPPPASANFSKKSSIEVYDNVGNPMKLDIYMTKSSAGWEVAVYNGDNPASFPATPIATETLTFNGTGQMSGPTSMSFGIPNGAPFTLDMTGMSELGGDYAVTGGANGNKPSAVKGAEFGEDGTVYAVYENGSRVAAFKVPLATVRSPDNLTPLAGNVYEASIASGGYELGTPGQSGFGSIRSGALEQSNVDIGAELTSMIEAQTAFSANSKSFQTGNEMLDVLINLKR